MCAFPLAGDPRRRPGEPAGERADWRAAFALGCAAAALVAWATSPLGVAVRHFGMNNIGAAEGLLSGRGLATERGEPFVHWGPLLPALLAGLKLAGLHFLDGARWLTIASAAFFVALHTQLLLACVRSRWTAIAAGALLLASLPFLALSTALVSQPLFLALCAALQFCLLQELRRPHAGWRVALGLFGAAACLHRYDGALVVAAVVLVLLLRPAGPGRARRLRAAAVVGALPLVALALLMARNLHVSGTFTGPRMAAPGAPAEQLLDAWNTLTLWLVPWSASSWLRSALVGLLFAALAPGWKRLGADPAALATYAAFPLIYGAGLLTIAAFVNLDLVGERLLVPLLPYLLGLLLLALEERIGTFLERGGRGVALGIAFPGLLLGLDFATGIPAVFSEAQRMHIEGAGGLATPEFRSRPLVGWLRAHPLDGTVFSNRPELVLVHGDRRALLPDGQSFPPHDGQRAWLVWIGRSEIERKALAELRQRVTLERVAELGDDAVFRLPP